MLLKLPFRIFWNLLKWFNNFIGFHFIYRKAFPFKEEPKERLPTFFIWLIGIYVALFEIASNRYEKSVQLIENRISAVVAQLGTSNSESLKNLYASIPKIQKMVGPVKPNFFESYQLLHDPDIYLPYPDLKSVFNSLFGAKVENADTTKWLKETLEISKHNLEGANLIGIDLRGADLIGANFKNAILSNAKFQDANLANATFEGATVTNAEFGGALIVGANFEKIIAQSANFEGVIITSKRFRESFWQTKYDKQSLELIRPLFSEKKPVRFNNSNLNEASFINSDLKWVEFENTTLINTDFQNSNLFKAKFKGAEIITETMEEADCDEPGAMPLGVQLTDDDECVIIAVSETNFDKAVLDEATWIDGKKTCADDSIGSCW